MNIELNENVSKRLKKNHKRLEEEFGIVLPLDNLANYFLALGMYREFEKHYPEKNKGEINNDKSIN